MFDFSRQNGKLVKIIGEENYAFLSQSINYLASNLLIRGMQFLTIPIMTAMLTPSEYGILGIYTSIVSIFITIIGLNFDSATVRFFYEKPEEYDPFFKSVNLFVTCTGMLMIIIIFIFRNQLASYFGVEQNIILYATVTPYFNNCYNMFLSTLQAKKDSSKYMKVTMIQRMIALSLTLLLIYLLPSEKYYGKIYAEIIVCLVTFLLLFKRFFVGATIKWEYVSYAAKIAIPLIPHVLSSFILSYFARIVINNMNGYEDAGIFSFAEDIGLVMLIVSMSFNKSWTPLFYQKMNDADYDGINKQTNQIIRISIMLAVALLFFAKEMVLLMSNENYYAALSVVPIIIIGKAFGPLYTIYSHFSDYYKKTIYISIATLIVGALNIVLNYLLIPEFGIIAGAFNSMICSVMLFICHYIVSQFMLHVRIIPLYPLLKNYSWLFLAGILYFIGLYYMNDMSFLAARFLFLLICIYYLFFQNVFFTRKKCI